MFMRMAIIDIINSSKIDVGCESGAGQSSRFVTAAARGRFQAVRGRLVYVVVRVRAVAGSDGAERVCAIFQIFFRDVKKSVGSKWHLHSCCRYAALSCIIKTRSRLDLYASLR